MKFLLKCAFISCFLLLKTIPANAETFQCAKETSLKQALTSNHPSWESYTQPSKIHTLYSVGFSHDHPAELGILKPHIIEDTNSDHIENIYIFSPSAPPSEIWISCNYDESRITLTKKLDPSISKCVVKYHQDSNLPEVSCL